MLVLSADTIATMLDADLVSPPGVSVFNQFILSLFFRNKLLEFSVKVHHKCFLRALPQMYRQSCIPSPGFCALIGQIVFELS